MKKASALYISLFLGSGAIACGSTGNSTPTFGDAGSGNDATATATATAKKDSGHQVLHQGDATIAQCSTGSANQEGCACTPGKTIACYSGPADTRNVAPCHDGKQKCQSNSEFAQFGPCVGEVDPSVGSSCVAVPDAAPPPPPPPHDAGHDAGTAMVAVGEACTPGSSVVQGMYPCSGSINECSGSGGCDCNDAGPAMPENEVFYCDMSGIYQMFPAGACTPATCTACMTMAGCAAMVPPAPDPCNGPATTALMWLESCGPDRSTYFSMLESQCPIVGQIQGCKDSCTSGISTGACSIW